MLIKVAPEFWEKQIRVEGSQGYYELLIFLGMFSIDYADNSATDL